MSNYLHNLVARSFGLVETAQPRVTSLFEPPRAFSPVDALQNSAPVTEEPAAAFDEDERIAPVSSARVQAAAPSPTIQTPASNALPSINNPSALPETESQSTSQASARRQHLSSVKPAQAEESAPSPATSTNEPQQSVLAPARPLQPFLQRETRDLTQQRTTTPASIRTDAPTVKSDARTSTQTIHPSGRAMTGPLSQVEEQPARVSQGKRPRAEAKERSDESTHARALPEQRSPVRAQVAEPRIVERALERALSTETQAPSLLKNESYANQHLPGLSRPLKMSAPGSPQQQTASQSISQPETETIVQHQQRPETWLVQPQVSRYVETQAQGALQQTRAPEPEQIVQVTIGRIEVRAATPAPAQARAQQKVSHQPSESLEEYLRQRARGGANR